MERALVLVDGEHYPPVVRAAIAAAGQDDRIVAALLLGGTEKLRGEPDYGVPLEHAGADAAAAMVAAAGKHAATRVVDLSDEPVLSEADRFRLINRALAAGLSYRGADFEFWPPPQAPAGVPAIAVIGTGKRIGKTAVCGHLARLLGERHRLVVIAMGRGGPELPELLDGAAEPPSVDDLLRRSRAGEHAASDFLEDAALARVDGGRGPPLRRRHGRRAVPLERRAGGGPCPRARPRAAAARGLGRGPSAGGRRPHRAGHIGRAPGRGAAGRPRALPGARLRRGGDHHERAAAGRCRPGRVRAGDRARPEAGCHRDRRGDAALPGRAGRGRARRAVHHGRSAPSTPGWPRIWPTSTAPR